MATNIAPITDIYKDFIQEAETLIFKLQKDAQMEDEQLATLTGSVIASAMSNSINAYESLRRVLLLDKQIVSETNRATDIASATAARDKILTKDLSIKDQQEFAERLKNGGLSYTYVYYVSTDQAVIDGLVAVGDIKSKTLNNGNAKSLYELQIEKVNSEKLSIDEQTAARGKILTKDLSIKDQQEFAERLKNGGLSYTYVYYVSTDQAVIDGLVAVGDIKSKTLNTTTQKSIYEAQIEKVNSDVLFVDEQKKQLGYSVIYNNRIKSLENYSDMIGNLGIGGYIISSDMFNTYFTMVNDIYINSGSTPVNKAITTPANLVLTKT